MNLKLGVDKVYAEMEEDYDDDIGEVTLEQAIEIIQRNERGRQGKQRAALVKRLRVEELRQRCGARTCARAHRPQEPRACALARPPPFSVFGNGESRGGNAPVRV
jgi:hypothetical protein